jgi:hypothetical protein
MIARMHPKKQHLSSPVIISHSHHQRHQQRHQAGIGTIGIKQKSKKQQRHQQALAWLQNSLLV